MRQEFVNDVAMTVAYRLYERCDAGVICRRDVACIVRGKDAIPISSVGWNEPKENLGGE